MQSAPPVVTVQPPAAPPGCAGPRTEVDRWEWRPGDGGDPVEQLGAFLDAHGLGGAPAAQRGGTAVALLAGATGCARLGGLPDGPASPVPAVPELAAVAYRLGGSTAGSSRAPAGAGP